MIFAKSHILLFVLAFLQAANVCACQARAILLEDRGHGAGLTAQCSTADAQAGDDGAPADRGPCWSHFVAKVPGPGAAPNVQPVAVTADASFAHTPAAPPPVDVPGAAAPASPPTRGRSLPLLI